MPKFLRSRKEIKKVQFHPVVDELIKLTSLLSLNSKINLSSTGLIQSIISTIKFEGVLSKQGVLYVFSPIFELHFLNIPIEEAIDKENTIIYTSEQISDEDIANRVWADIFKHLLLAKFSGNDLSIIQTKLKEFLPHNNCQSFFGKNFLSQSDLAKLAGSSRAKIAHGSHNAKKPLTTSFKTFDSFAGEHCDE